MVEEGRLKGGRGREGMREGKTDINMDRAEGSLFKPSCAVYTRFLNQTFLPASLTVIAVVPQCSIYQNKLFLFSAL